MLNPQIEVRVATITPEVARNLLERNHSNRPMNEAHAEELARRMKNGEWRLNGETMILDEKGDLLNGQHRCLGVVKSGVSIQTLLVGRVQHEAFATIDNTRPKSHADMLSASGEISAALMAAALRTVDMYQTGAMRSKRAYSNLEIASLLATHPHIRESMNLCKNAKGLIPASSLTALHYLFAKVDAKAALKFVDDLIGGTGLSGDDPVYVLRERLVANRVSSARLSKTYIMAITVKAWNARRNKTTVSNFLWREGGDKPEAFPVIQ